MGVPRLVATITRPAAAEHAIERGLGQLRAVVRQRQVRRDHQLRRRPRLQHHLQERHRLLVRQVAEPPADAPLQRRRIRPIAQHGHVVVALEHHDVAAGEAPAPPRARRGRSR